MVVGDVDDTSPYCREIVFVWAFQAEKGDGIGFFLGANTIEIFVNFFKILVSPPRCCVS